MKKKVLAIFLSCMLVSTSAFAHVMNRHNVFEDLALTEAADEIVMLSALGIVSYLDNGFAFKPTTTLTAKDLAAWVAMYNGIQAETSDELAKAALEAELVTTIEGDATYTLVNEAYFHGKLTLENPEQTMTREQFALFVFEHLTADIGNHTLLDMSQFTPGPTGVVEHAERVTKNIPSGSTTSVYMITINGEQYEMGMHPRVIADSVDPTVWIGQKVAQSWYGPNATADHAGHNHSHQNHTEHANDETKPTISPDTVAETALQVVVIGEVPFIATEKGHHEAHGMTAEQLTEQTAEEVEQVLAEAATEQEQEKPSTNSNTWLYIVLVALAIVIIGFVASKLKRKKAA